uniref:Uncharacterized protein n=1 Tax=Aegilops tauschii subsp. strangulata TaxID=200361 RepID=A0A453QCT3_AEGTS
SLVCVWFIGCSGCGFDECRQYQSHIRGLNTYDRHKKFMKDYVSFMAMRKMWITVCPSKLIKIH